MEIYQYAGFNAYSQATITDFNVAEDQIQFDSYLSQQLQGWDGASNPFGAGFLRLIDDGNGNALFQVDTNGGGDTQ